MNPQNHKLQQNQEAGHAVSSKNSATEQSALEFATGDEAIRHDASSTPLPPAIAERLRRSIEQEPPKPAGGWWKAFFKTPEG